jgi:carbonic anhydrase
MSSLLQQIRECNKSYLDGHPRLLDASGEPFIVVACIDPRLTGVLEPALGLPRHRAMVIRIAGNVISDDSRAVLRSIAAGIYLKKGSEIFVVGHTDCAMSAFSTSEVIESFRNAGIPRSAFGDGDLREWFRAFSDIRGNVIDGIAALRRSGLFPATLKIHGLVMNTETGAVEVVEDGSVVPAQGVRDTDARGPSAPETRPVPEKAASRTAEAPIHVPPPPAIPTGTPQKPVVIQPPSMPLKPKGTPPSSVADAVMRLREFFVQEQHDQHFQRSLSDLKALLMRERNPMRILPALERLVQDYKDRYPNIAPAIAYLKKSLDAKGGTAGMHFMELMRRVLE